MANAKNIPAFSAQEKNTPSKKFRSGNVKGTVWKNKYKDPKSGREFEVESLQIEKVYKDKDGNWKSVNSYNKNEVGKLLGVILRFMTESVTTDDSEIDEETA